MDTNQVRRALNTSMAMQADDNYKRIKAATSGLGEKTKSQHALLNSSNWLRFDPSEVPIDDEGLRKVKSLIE